MWTSLGATVLPALTTMADGFNRPKPKLIKRRDAMGKMRTEHLCPERRKTEKGTGHTGERGTSPEDTMRESWRERDREAGSGLEDLSPGPFLKLFESVNTQVQDQQRQAG